MKIKIVSGNAGERSISAQIPFSGMNSQSCADRLAPDMAPYQLLWEGPAGNTAKKKNKKSTFKAGMCMKTKETLTICPKTVGHFCLSFGHFRLTDTNFSEFRGEFMVAYQSIRTAIPGISQSAPPPDFKLYHSETESRFCPHLL
jgi:hypothetical protein